MLKKEVSETKQEQNVDAEVMILSSLAKPDALKIFSACEKGMGSSTEAIKNLCLTPKCYYTNLKRLIDAGLVEKRGQIYVQTALGKFCDKLWKEFSRAVSQRDQLQLTDKLMKSNTFSTEEKEKILNVIEDPRLTEIIHGVKMISDYDNFIEEVKEMLNGAKESAYLAASKIDLRVTDAVINAMGRGVKVYALSSPEPGSEVKELLRMLLSPASIKMVRMLFSSEQINMRLTTFLSFSFLIVDDEYGVIELPHPALHEFHAAFRFRNALFCQGLFDIFTSLYEEAREDPRVGSIRKYLSFHK